MKRMTGVFQAIILVLPFATACGNAEHTNVDRSAAAGSGRIRGIGRGHYRRGAAGTNGEQITSEAVVKSLLKRGYVAKNWMELFGVEKLAMSRVYICPSRRAISRYCQFLRMMVIGDRYYANSADAIFTSALGGVIVPVGEGCHPLAIRHRGELFGWIEGWNPMFQESCQHTIESDWRAKRFMVKEAFAVLQKKCERSCIAFDEMLIE